jgi:hypothetical protein
MFLSNTYKYKISSKIKQFYFITTTPGLHVSTSSSHHQAIQGTDPRLSKYTVHSGIPSTWDPRMHENLDNLGSVPWMAWWGLEEVETCSPGVVVIK